MDKELVEKIIEGDEEAFSIMVGQTIDAIYRFVFRLVSNEQDAQDIVQEVYLKIWKKKDTFKSDLASFNTWMYSIARNTTIDFFRKKKDLSFSKFDQEDGANSIIDTLADKELLPNEVAILKEDSLRLNEAVQKLATFYREVVILRGIEEKSFQEVSDILGRPIETVKSQYKRALNLLYHDLSDT